MGFGRVEGEEEVDEESEKVVRSRVHSDTPVAAGISRSVMALTYVVKVGREGNAHGECENEGAQEKEWNRYDRLRQCVDSWTVQAVATFSHEHGTFFEECRNTGDYEKGRRLTGFGCENSQETMVLTRHETEERDREEADRESIVDFVGAVPQVDPDRREE